jgi:hypothetical protein
VVIRDQQTELLRLRSHRRHELVQAVCRLHRELVILIPGGACLAAQCHPNPRPAQRDPASR